MKIIDAHSHIDYISHNYQSDVVGTVVCATIVSEWDRLERIINGDKKVYGAFGIHPWFVDSVDFDFVSRLECVLKNNSSYMIGEIGLDKNKPNVEKQIKVFRIQFELAIKLKRTVFIHCVGAWDKILHILKQYKKSDLPMMVFHAFNGNDDITKSLLKYYKNNIYFSFDKNALYGDSCRIKRVPFDKILVESDGHKDVILKDIIDNITKITNDTNMPSIIYNNTERVLQNG